MDNLNLCHVFARNCEVRRVGKDVAASFLDANHRMGHTSCRYCYGLFVSRTTSGSEVALEVGTLAAVATFSSPRKWDKNGVKVSSFEWVRYASLDGVRVIGGMGKLLSAFVADVHPDDVMSYADASWSDGDAYKVLGFECEGLVEKPEFRCLKFRLKLTDYSSQ